MLPAKISIVLTVFFLLLVSGCLEPPADSPAPLPTQSPGNSFSEKCMPSLSSVEAESENNNDSGGETSEEDCVLPEEQPVLCVAFNGDKGITGKLATPQILNQWSWNDEVISMDALDASNSKGVYGDAYQFFIVLFKKLKFAQEVALESKAEPIEVLLSFELLLKPDNYAEALKAFDESRNTQFFDAPSWFTQEWFVLSEHTEAGEPVIRFSPEEITSPGRYRVRIQYSNPDQEISGQEASFVVEENGKFFSRYNALTVSIEKTADPEIPNPLYWISLDTGLSQKNGFGVQFKTESQENQDFLWTDSIDAGKEFLKGKKTVQILPFDSMLSGSSFEVINSPPLQGIILRMHPEAQWMIFSPNTPVSIAALLNSENHSKWTYRFIHENSSWSPESTSTILKWNAITSTSNSCEGVPREMQDQWESNSDCDGSGFTAQLTGVNNSSVNGQVIATTTVFVPKNQSWSMYSCTNGISLADTTQAHQNSVFELKNGSGIGLEVSSINDIIKGIESEEICVVTKDQEGESLDEVRFEWNAYALELNQFSAAGNHGISNFTACPLYAAPEVPECVPATNNNNPKPVDKESKTDLYNAGFKIIEIPYSPKSGSNTQSIPMAIWYPTTAATKTYLYSSFHPESKVALNAPIAEGTFPLIIFAHGNMTTGVQSVFLTEYLAERGYVIAATDYDDAIFDLRTGEPIAPGGVPFFGRWFPDLWSDGSPALYRRDESHAILEKLCSLNMDSKSQFFNRFDFSRLGAVGHSLGGYTIAGLIGGYESWREPDIKAAVLHSPFLAPFEYDSGNLGQISIPVMIQGGTADFLTIESPQLQKLAKKITSTKHFMIFKDFDHFAWSDLPCQEFASIEECRKDQKTKAIISYTTAFLDYYIKGDNSAKPKLSEQNPLLTVFENS